MAAAARFAAALEVTSSRGRERCFGRVGDDEMRGGGRLGVRRGEDGGRRWRVRRAVAAAGERPRNPS